METYNLMPLSTEKQYRVHDIIEDIFEVGLTDAQADKLLGLCQDWDSQAIEDRVISFTDTICQYFVGRGLPWHKESRTEEQIFWSRIKEEKGRFMAFITL